MKKIWMILPAILLAFGLVFIGCGGDDKKQPELPPSDGNTVIDTDSYVWTLEGWFGSGRTSLADPLVSSGNSSSVSVGSGILSFTSRPNDYTAVDIKLRGSGGIGFTKSVGILAEGTTATPSGEIKTQQNASPYATYGTTNADGTGAYVLTGTVPAAGVDAIRITTGGGDTGNYTISKIVLWNLSGLNDAIDLLISEAYDRLYTVSPSDDGEDVIFVDYWVPIADWDAYESAIKAAGEVDVADGAALVEAINELQAATEVFNEVLEAKEAGKVTDSGAILDTLVEEIDNVKDALVEAEEYLIISVDGTDVSVDDIWTTQAALDALLAVIEAAEAAAEDTEATAVTLGAAINALREAIEVFEATIQNGLRDSTALSDAIDAAKVNLASVEIDTDGTATSSLVKWVTQAVYDAYNTAISAAETALGAGDATVASFATAVTTLAGATTTFNAAKEDGAKAAVPYEVPAAPDAYSFYVDLNEYDTPANEFISGSSAGVPEGGTTASDVTLIFTANSQLANFKLSTEEAALINSAESVSVKIVGTATPDSTFRFFIGNADTGSNWNKTNSSGDGAFSTLLDKTGITFANAGTSANYFMLQQRVDATTTVVIESILITVPEPLDYTPVTGITGVPTSVPADTTTIDLSTAAIAPNDASTDADIVWSLKDAGTTGASLNADGVTIENISAAGTIVVTATIADGLAEGTDFVKDYSIIVVREPTSTSEYDVEFTSDADLTLNGSIVAVYSDELGGGDEIGYSVTGGVNYGGAYVSFQVEFDSGIYLADFASVSFTYNAVAGDATYKNIRLLASDGPFAGSVESNGAYLYTVYGTSAQTGGLVSATVTIPIDQALAEALDGTSDPYIVIHVHAASSAQYEISNIVFNPRDPE